jgi:hypothetical protein
MTLVNYSYGARFARPRGTGSMGISSLQKFPRGTGGMGISSLQKFPRGTGGMGDIIPHH